LAEFVVRGDDSVVPIAVEDEGSVLVGPIVAVFSSVPDEEVPVGGAFEFVLHVVNISLDKLVVNPWSPGGQKEEGPEGPFSFVCSTHLLYEKSSFQPACPAKYMPTVSAVTDAIRIPMMRMLAIL